MRFTTTKKKEPEIFKDIDVDENKYFLKINGNSYEDTMQNVANKLGQLEDIENELGIDLITLFTALKNGVYYFTNERQLTKDYVWLLDNYISVGTRDKLSYSFVTGFEKQILSFKDYGNTWALTKEELE